MTSSLSYDGEGLTAMHEYGIRSSLFQLPTKLPSRTFHRRRTPSAPEVQRCTHSLLWPSATATDTRAAVLEECDIVLTTLPCAGENRTREPLFRPSTTPGAGSLAALSSSSWFLRFLFLFGPSSDDEVSKRAQHNEDTREDSRACSATDWPVVVSYMRRRCLSTASERNAKSSPLGEKVESEWVDEASSTAGWEMPEVLAGRDFGALLRGFFDFDGVEAILAF